jgi:hypothetical protein
MLGIATIRRKLKPISLKHGSHSSPEDGMCALEAIAYVAEEPFGDHPACVCPVIAAFLRSWNDGMPTDDDRDRLLKPLLPLVIGTADPAKVDTRAFLAIDWVVRQFAPTWLDLVPALKVHAEALRKQAEITSWEGLIAATPILVDSRKSSTAPLAAAWAAAWAAALDAALAAALDAARAAPLDALKPTTAALQDSAADLVRRMCAA